MAFLRDSFKESGASIDKAVAPGLTLARVRNLLERFDPPLVEEVRRIDSGRLGIPVYACRYTPFARSITGAHKQMGKGETPEQAEASAVMELVERFSVFSFAARPHDIRTLEDLGEAAIPIEEILSSLPLGAFGHKAVSRLSSILSRIPLPWVSAYAPIQGKKVFLPWSWFWTINEYNGSAAGNTLEEATVQALCEVVERHVSSLIALNGIKTPAIDPASIENPASRSLLQRYRSAGVHVVLKDFSLCMGIPTVGAIAWDPATFPARSEIVSTAGTAPHPERAAIRALTEVAQLAGDFDTDGQYLECGLPKHRTLEEAALLTEATVTVPIQELPSIDSTNFLVEIERAASALALQGLSTYVVDITHPGLGIPCAYVVIPGNRFRERTQEVDCISHAARLACSCPNPDTASSLLKELYDTFPGRSDIPYYMGLLHENSGDPLSALTWHRLAASLAELPREKARIFCHIGNCLQASGDFTEAERALLMSIELDPGLKEAHNLLGYCRYRTGRHYEAIEAFEKAISLDPGSAIDYANIASNLRALGLNGPAIHWYKMALELDPDISWAQEHLAGLLKKNEL
ncbi:MAG: YcaO-like family protein [Deltaproteobacteria bacterium]